MLWRRFNLLCSWTENMECKLWEERSLRPSVADGRKASASSEEERDQPREASVLLWLMRG